MKRIKSLIAVSIFMSLFVSAFMMAQPVTASAAEKEKCYIVAIHGKSLAGSVNTPATTQTEVTVEPMSLRVPLGSCVVWVNWANRPEVSISFKEGKACQSAAEAYVGFKLTPKTGCFVTDYLQMGQTSSLMFMHVGTYKYELNVQGKVGPVATGEIVVYKK